MSLARPAASGDCKHAYKRAWVCVVCVLLCLQEKAQAQAFANALATIGKFVLKKKAGDKDQLFGR